ncbi:hypothetical protein [Nakamurella sp. PAMC28650]|uniref:hypothetical protein n=1 Tax=Nakamurella sp. PAMC28650 TaxID=2762325 RepID=UPI00164D0DE9|nr:hypothetical protein [Nakamurella sp. PAMC28650]QNK82561.1 hypothetical protein H7F38_07605 [Nakamurella sp. PAMC28650]
MEPNPRDEQLAESMQELGEFYQAGGKTPSNELVPLPKRADDVEHYYGGRKQLPLLAPEVPESLNRLDRYTLQKRADEEVYSKQLGEILKQVDFHFLNGRTIQRMQALESLKDMIEAKMASGRCTSIDVAMYTDVYRRYLDSTGFMA